MGKYLGNTGLGYLWSKYKQRYELKSSELPSITYTHSVGGNSPIPVTATILVVHSLYRGEDGYLYSNYYCDTMVCSLSQPVDVNLVFELNWTSGSNPRVKYFNLLAGKTSITFQDIYLRTGSTSYRLYWIREVNILSVSTLASKYTFTVDFQQVGAIYGHTISLENASVDWHTMTVSGTLTRTTDAETKPQVNTFIEVCKPVNGESVYYQTAQQTISANSTTTSLTNVPIVPVTDGTTSFGYRLSPIVSSLVNPPEGHLIFNEERAYTSLPANVTINIYNWAQRNLQPTLRWYRSTGACVYSGTLPSATFYISGILPNDRILIKMYAYFGTYNSTPYTFFQRGLVNSSITTGSGYMTFNFTDVNNYFVDIPSSGTVTTTYIIMDAYLSNTDKGIEDQYIGYWPSSNTSTITGSFTQAFTKPSMTTRPKCTTSGTNGLFGTVTLDGRLW